jgi:hypothetical protein
MRRLAPIRELLAFRLRGLHAVAATKSGGSEIASATEVRSVAGLNRPPVGDARIVSREHANTGRGGHESTGTSIVR